MNLPNKLTVSRFVVTGAFLGVMVSDLPARTTIALALFTAASLTDYFDGVIARRNKLVTNFGILMDPLADKILVCSAFIAFVEQGWIKAWMVIIIVARELTITGLRLLAALKNQVLAAERFGKHKTISQIVAIVAILVYNSYTEWGQLGEWMFGFQVFGEPWIVWFMPLSRWVAVILTAVSGLIYLWRNRELYLQDC